jgi:PAS domain S-box-containing protein
LRFAPPVVAVGGLWRCWLLLGLVIVGSAYAAGAQGSSSGQPGIAAQATIDAGGGSGWTVEALPSVVHFPWYVVLAVFMGAACVAWAIWAHVRLARAKKAHQQELGERRRVEAALRGSEARFRDLVEVSSDWVWEVDSRGIYTFCAGQVKNVLGYNPEEMLGRHFSDFLAPLEEVRIRQHFEAAMHDQAPLRHLQNWCVAKDGREICLSTSGVPFFDQDGNLLGYRGLDSDITDRTRVLEYIQESELRYRTLFDASPEGVFIMGDTILECNLQAGRLWHCSPDEAVGTRPEAFAPPRQPDGRDSGALFQAYLQSARRGETVRFYWQSRRRDGQLADVEMTLARIALRGETLVLACMRDVSERHRLLREIEAAQADSSRDVPDRGHARTASSQPAHAWQAADSGRPIRVLLADDHVPNQKVMTRLLERWGCTVETAANGQEALRSFQRGQFDLVLMDVQMPLADGFEATAAIRRVEAECGGHVPIIALTANAMVEDRERCIEAGMDAHIAKPVNPEDLKVLMESVLAGGATLIPSTPRTTATHDQGAVEAAVFDRARLLARLEGDQELFSEVVQIFLADLGPQVEALGAALRTGDHAGAVREAHGIRGSAANIGADALSLTAWRIERAVVELDHAQAVTLLDELSRDMAALRKGTEACPDEES